MTYKPIFSDYVILIAFLLFATAHVTTYYLINSYQSVAEKLDIAQDVVLQYEANPFTRLMMSIGNIRYIYTFIFLPSVFFGMYYIVRKKCNEVAAGAMAMAFFMAGLLNVLNDLTVLFGFLAVA